MLCLYDTVMVTSVSLISPTFYIFQSVNKLNAGNVAGTLVAGNALQRYSSLISKYRM